MDLSQIEHIVVKAKQREEEEGELLQTLVSLLGSGARAQQDILDGMVKVASKHWTIDDMLLISFALDQGEPVDRIKRYLARFEGRSEKEAARMCRLFETEHAKMERGIQWGSVDGIAQVEEQREPAKPASGGASKSTKGKRKAKDKSDKKKKKTKHSK